MLRLAWHMSKNELVLKRSTNTRWSAKYAAVRALRSSYQKVRDLLISLLSEDSVLPNDQKSAARGLLKKLTISQTTALTFLLSSKYNKINHLSLICIESKILETINFQEVINAFINAISRRFFKPKQS